jgi:hypothetical protein
MTPETLDALRDLHAEEHRCFGIPALGSAPQSAFFGRPGDLPCDAALLIAEADRLRTIGDALIDSGEHCQKCRVWDSTIPLADCRCSCGWNAAVRAWEGLE